MGAPYRPAPPSDRTSKRPRHSSDGTSKENTSLVAATSTGAGSKRSNVGATRPSKADEDAFMADLLAGIDTSVFDLPPSQSPVKSQVPLPALSPVAERRNPKTHPSSQRSPRKRSSQGPNASTAPKAKATGALPNSVPKREPLSPKKSATGNQVDLFSILGLAPAKKKVAADVKPSLNQRRVTPTHKLDAAKTQSSVKAEPTVKSEPAGKVEAPTPVVSRAVPLLSTPTFLDVDTDDYDGDWDMAALASMDEAQLFCSSTSVAPRYPILHPLVPEPPKDYKSVPFERCMVEGVYDGILDHIPERLASQDAPPARFSFAVTAKTLVVATSSGQRLVHLKERWVDLKIRRGDIVNVISPTLAAAGPIVVTMKDSATYIIHHPDVLVTMTSIANAMPCARRPVVQQLVKLPEPPSKAMLYGTVLHSLLQDSLSEQSFDRQSTARRVATELAREERRLEVWGAGLDPLAVSEELGPTAEDAFASFGDKWIGPIPTSNGEVKTARDEQVGTLAINGLHDIEEDIWSPKWGLKGKVDASVQAVMKKDGETTEFVAPLEIKTGRSIGGVAHRAQTMLYTLLMEDRYCLPIPAGLLYYSQRDTIVLVEARNNEVRALIMARNELAEWMFRERSTRAATVSNEPDSEPTAIEDRFLPETTDTASDCKRCYASDVCMLYRKAVDKVPAPEDDPIGELFESKTGHLTDAHAKFFAHWERLLSLEEQDTLRLRSQLWTMTASAREKVGRAFASMVIVKEENSSKSLNRIHKWAYAFERSPGVDASHTLLSGHIARGDPVAISIDELPCLARGFVTELSPTRITVALASQLDLTELLKRTRSSLDPNHMSFRIDRDELASGMARMRGNLAHMFLTNGDAKRRRLVVDLAKPEFDDSKGPAAHEIPASLNEDQRKAMTKVLTAKDYALVLGMPGTGKTTTIAEIIKAIVERGQSVLLTSYTHSAVDTIVTKLLGADFQVLRIGNQDKVHPDVRHLTLDALGPSAAPEQMAARLMDPPVVAATCLAVEHPLFYRRRFDYCIVDEASQITLPTCLGPLRCAETFVLVGDHFQLPPIVRKAEARAGGLDVSLFRRLSDAHPDAVAPLAAQYRMNEDIMLLSNRLIYENRLRCGSEAVANQVLTLRSRKTCPEISPSTCGEDCWVQGLMEESAKAVFVDTDTVPGRETRAGELVQNPTEASLVYTLVRALVHSGVREHDIAVITPYRQQIKLLSTFFTTLPKVELLTADKAQGRDKDVIIFSMVRSNEDGNVGGLLRDWRRINVSFTRAKKKLVIFGSRSTLLSDRLLADFFSLVEEQQWVRRLPRGADQMHGEVKSNTLSDDKESKAVKEELGEGKSKDKGKRAVLGERLVNAHPFVKEILEEVNTTTIN